MRHKWAEAHFNRLSQVSQRDTHSLCLWNGAEGLAVIGDNCLGWGCDCPFSCSRKENKRQFARLGVNCDVHDGHTLESREHWRIFLISHGIHPHFSNKGSTKSFHLKLAVRPVLRVWEFLCEAYWQHQQRWSLAMRYVRLSYWTNALSNVTAKPLSPERVIEEAADHWASTPLCCK